jgi:hypothetical protein
MQRCDDRGVPWKLTVRSGPKVESSRYKDLDDALSALERCGRALVSGVPADPVDVRFTSYEPVEQVSARIELAGPERLFPKVHVGVDVRGDGSTEPYSGRVNRQVIELRKGESAYDALRRTVTTSGGAASPP